MSEDLGGWPSFWWMNWRMGFNRLRDPMKIEVETMLWVERNGLKTDTGKVRESTLKTIAEFEKLAAVPDVAVVEYYSLPEWNTEAVQGLAVRLRLFVSVRAETIVLVADPGGH